jgi:SulP family sulfate permease
VAAVTITVVMLLFTDLLAYLPSAALAGIVANAVLNLIEVHELKVLWRMRQSEFWIAMVCLLSVLVLGPLKAVIIAFLMATIDVVRRASHPATAVMVETGEGGHFLPVDPDKLADTGGLVVYCFRAPLYFANASRFQEEVEHLVTNAEAPVRWFVLDAEAMTDMDVTGKEAFHDAMDLLARLGITLAISRANRPMTALLDHYGALENIGRERLYPSNRHAMAAYRKEHPGNAANSSERREP